MARIQMTEVIRRSWTRTSDLLFRKPSLKTWLKLAGIALLAGQLFSSQFDGSSLRRQEKPAQQPVSSVLRAPAANSSTDGPLASTGSASAKGVSSAPIGLSGKRTFTESEKLWKDGVNSRSPFLIPVVIFLVALAIVSSILFGWISARFGFVWFHAVATGEVTVAEPFHRHRAEGNSLFKIGLVFALVSMAAVGGLIFVLAGLMRRSGTTVASTLTAAENPSSVPLVLGIVLLVIFFIVLVSLLSIILHFVVPVMALDRISFFPAWKKFTGIFAANRKNMLFFYLWLVLLKVVSGFLGLAAVVVVTLAAILLSAVIFGAGYAILVTALKLMPLFIVYCVILGTPVLIAFFACVTCAWVPIAVFFRSYGLEFLCALEGGYTPADLDAYRESRSSETSRTPVGIAVLSAVLTAALLFGGLVAAIGIPNFIKARNEARANASAPNGAASKLTR